MKPVDNKEESEAHLIGNFDSRVNQLPIVASVERHARVPEVSEEVRQDLLANVRRLDAVRAAALLHHLHDHGLL